MLTEIHHDQIIELRLSRPPVNAINPTLLLELSDSIKKYTKNQGDKKAIIISGAPGMFSAGLDVPALLELSRPEMQSFWRMFLELWRDLASSPIPIVAALTGHSPAGGTVLSLFCDYRVLAEGKFKVGLNEAQVGLIAPMPVVYALQRLVGIREAERHLVAGDLISPEKALQIGLVDELAPVDDVVNRAITWCEKHLQLPEHAMSGSRVLTRNDLHAVCNEPLADALFLDQWFSPETQQVLKALAARLKG